MAAARLSPDQLKILRSARERLRLAPAELATRLEVSRPYLVMLEHGRKAPSSAMLERWAHALGYDVRPAALELIPRARGRRRK